jgi:hypothetical protein
MSKTMKFLIGLAAALLAASLWHGPAGQGEKLIAKMEAQARQYVALGKLPGISVRLERSPLARSGVLSGNADEIQREGLGSQYGLMDYARAVDGMARVRWDDQPAAWGLPLLAELLLLAAAAYLLGFGVGARLFGRRRRESFLD